MGQDLENYRLQNETGGCSANSILQEEIAEAVVAYFESDKEHCIQELAQCGAVILRMMEFVDADLKSDKLDPKVTDSL